MFPKHITIFVGLVAFAHAGLTPAVPLLDEERHTVKVTSVVHNAPSAVSHQSFTRIHNAAHAQPFQTSFGQEFVAVPPASDEVISLPLLTHIGTHDVAKAELRTIPVYGTAAFSKSYTPRVETLTHTPAHLTYAASPIVYKMLPTIKTVGKINYDSSETSSYDYH